MTPETPRLLLRPWTEQNAEALYKYAGGMGKADFYAITKEEWSER